MNHELKTYKSNKLGSQLLVIQEENHTESNFLISNPNNRTTEFNNLLSNPNTITNYVLYHINLQ